jgi:hypothetical protein
LGWILHLVVQAATPLRLHSLWLLHLFDTHQSFLCLLFASCSSKLQHTSEFQVKKLQHYDDVASLQLLVFLCFNKLPHLLYTTILEARTSIAASHWNQLKMTENPPPKKQLVNKQKTKKLGFRDSHQHRMLWWCPVMCWYLQKNKSRFWHWKWHLPKSSDFNYVTNQQPHHHECKNNIKFNSVLCNWLSNSPLETASLQCTSWVILKGMYLLEFFTSSLSIRYDPPTTNPKNWMTQFLLL